MPFGRGCAARGAPTGGVVRRLFHGAASSLCRDPCRPEEPPPGDRFELLDVVVETEADLHGDLEVVDRLVGEVARISVTSNQSR